MLSNHYTGTQLFCTAVITCLAITSGLFADTNPSVLPEDKVLTVHPDKDIMIQTDPEDFVFMGESDPITTSLYNDCSNFGSWAQIAGDDHLFRGDVFEVDDVRYLTDFAMELSFSGTTNLWFYVYERQAGQSEFHQMAGRMLYTDGIGRDFYNSGAFNPPLELMPGNRYVIGVAWDDVSVIFAYKNQSSTTFPQGTLKGLTSLSGITNPLSDIHDFFLYTSAVYSMEACFLPLPGACCLPNNTCTELMHAECLDQNGTYTADGVACSEFNSECPIDKGACCIIPDGCFDMNPYACEETGGIYKGDNSSCAMEACNPRGACCVFGPEGCIENLTACECEALDQYGRNTWTEGATCNDIICLEIGACCSSDEGACLDTFTQSGCDDANGIFMGAGVPCDPSPCAENLGACCNLDGTCDDTKTPYLCDQQGGTYMGNQSNCSEVECAPLGACCNYDGSCSDDLTEYICENDGGTYQGNGTECGTSGLGCEIKGACCVNGGDRCLEITEPVCNIYPSSTFMPGAHCDPTPCKGPLGFCCLEGQCIEINETDCLADGGTWYLDETTCQSSCPTPDPKGACCLGDDGCQRTTQAECTTLNGDYLGDNTFCYQCASGACCSEFEPCTQVRRFDCQYDQSGIDFMGEFTLCEVNTCGFCDDNYPGAEYGDYNADGYVNYLDADAFTSCQLGPGTTAPNKCRCAFDFDYDKDVDLEDYTQFENMYCSHCCDKHDWNRDGMVTDADLVGFINCMAGPGVQPVPPIGSGDSLESCICVFDTDMDNDVDLADFISFQSSLTTAP